MCYWTQNRRFTEMLDCSFKSNISLFYRGTVFSCYRGVITVHMIVSSKVSKEDPGPGLSLVQVPVSWWTGRNSSVSIYSSGVQIQICMFFSEPIGGGGLQIPNVQSYSWLNLEHQKKLTGTFYTFRFSGFVLVLVLKLSGPFTFR